MSCSLCLPVDGATFSIELWRTSMVIIGGIDIEAEDEGLSDSTVPELLAMVQGAVTDSGPAVRDVIQRC